MKNKKEYFIIAFCILYFALAFQEPPTIFNEQEFKDDKNSITYLSTSDSVVVEWNCTWGGSASEQSFGVAVDSSDNIYLAGFTESFGAGDKDMALVKYDNSGEQQWNRTWGGVNSEYGLGVAVDSSDNVYFAGVTRSFGAGDDDMALVKYDSNGIQQWNRTWGGLMNEWGYEVAVDSLDNVYLVGDTSGFGADGHDIVLVKYNSSGVQQWYYMWGENDYDFGYGVAVDSSDNVYLVGTASSYGVGDQKIVLVKYNSSGMQQWNRTWDGVDSDYGLKVAVDSADNVYVSGETRSFGAGNADMVLVKYDSNGVQQWNRTWGGTEYDGAHEVVVDSLNNVYLAGWTYSFGAGEGDMVLVKYDSSGVQQWNYTWGGSDEDWGSGTAVDSFNNVYLAGDTISFGAGYVDMALVKYVPDTYDPIVSIKSPSPDDKFGDKAPDYNISIVEPNLESMWYTIDDGLTNHSITQLSGTINQSSWDATSYGSITIQFWARDLEGNIGYREVVVEKEKEKKEPVIPGYNLFFLISAISIITVISLKKKYK